MAVPGHERENNITIFREYVYEHRSGFWRNCSQPSRCARPGDNIGAGNMCLDASTVSEELHVAP